MIFTGAISDDVGIVYEASAAVGVGWWNGNIYFKKRCWETRVEPTPQVSNRTAVLI